MKRRKHQGPTKRCTVCRSRKPVSDFYVNTNGQPRSQCKRCANAEKSRQYHADPERWRRRERVRQLATRRLNMEAVWRYLSTHPCVDCGEADPIVLEFDHVFGVKRAPIATLVNNRTWEVIAAEIDKCVVRCANCHRRKTAAVSGWYGYLGRDHMQDRDDALALINKPKGARV